MGMEYLRIMYVIVINIIGFSIMWIDKRRSKNHKWRVPEKRLWLVAIIGGSIGSIIGMHLFRHKTKHTLFLIGMPLILIIQLILMLLWFIG